MNEGRVGDLKGTLFERFVMVREVTECILDLEQNMLFVIVVVPDPVEGEEPRPIIDDVMRMAERIEFEFRDTGVGAFVVARFVGSAHESEAYLRTRFPLTVYQRTVRVAPSAVQ